MHSLVLYRIERLPGEGTIQSREHHPRGTHERDTPPVFTSVDLTEKLIARDYCLAELTHYEGTVLRAIWRNEHINECVLVYQPDAYYSRTRGFFIFEAPAQLARAATARMHADCAKDFALIAVHLDFEALLREKQHPEMVVLGAWSRGNEKTPIRSRAAFAGQDMRKQAAFQDMLANGSLSTLSVRLTFRDQPLRVSLSQWGSVVMYSEVDLETRIAFMEHLAKYTLQVGKRRKKKVA